LNINKPYYRGESYNPGSSAKKLENEKGGGRKKGWEGQILPAHRDPHLALFLN